MGVAGVERITDRNSLLTEDLTLKTIDFKKNQNSEINKNPNI